MFPVMKNGKEFYFPKGRRGSKGEPAVPPSHRGLRIILVLIVGSEFTSILLCGHRDLNI